MARLIQALASYGPKVERTQLADMERVSELVAKGTGLTEGEVSLILRELHKAILYHNRAGTPVQLPGIGIFATTVDRHGRRRIRFRMDSTLRAGMNGAAARRLPVKNAGNIGLDNAGYKALWDAEHPEDPLEIP